MIAIQAIYLLTKRILLKCLNDNNFQIVLIPLKERKVFFFSPIWIQER